MEKSLIQALSPELEYFRDEKIRLEIENHSSKIKLDDMTKTAISYGEAILKLVEAIQLVCNTEQINRIDKLLKEKAVCR
jgi:hypothetical protein